MISRRIKTIGFFQFLSTKCRKILNFSYINQNFAKILKLKSHILNIVTVAKLLFSGTKNPHFLITQWHNFVIIYLFHAHPANHTLNSNPTFNLQPDHFESAQIAKSQKFKNTFFPNNHLACMRCKKH